VQVGTISDNRKKMMRTPALTGSLSKTQDVMKNASNTRRGRARSGGKRNQGSRNRNYQSSGGDNKVRGSAQQVLDKYLTMARDATAAGDRIAAEGFFQHAEHYYRVLNDRSDQQNKSPNDRQQKTGLKGKDNRPERADKATPEAAGSKAPGVAVADSQKPARKGRPPKADSPEAEAVAGASKEAQTSGDDDEAAA